MNFKGHVTGGIIVGTLLAASALALNEPLNNISLGGIPLGDSTLGDPSLNMFAALILLGKIFAVTLFFSMFPDLDISSIPQRWFYRALFIILLVMAYKEFYEEATLLALISITPLLDHHRSWTHHFISALLFPVVLACLYEYLLTKAQFLDQWSFEVITNHLKQNIWLVVALIMGWYTHLFLDYLQKHKLKRIRQKAPALV